MAPRLILRAAHPEDLETLFRFSLAMAQETEGRRLDRAQLRRGIQAVLAKPELGQLRVAQLADRTDPRIVGQLMITYEWSDWRNGTFWWIQSVYVDPAWRRRGVYRAMHDAIRREARASRGICGLRLYVEHGNRTAQRTYRRVGMKPSPYRVFEEDFVLPHPIKTRPSPTGRPRRRSKGGPS